MKVQDMTCPKCGATMALNEEKGKAECAYCGYRRLVERKETMAELRERMRSSSYGYHKGKLEAEAEAKRKGKLRSIRNTVMVLAVLAAVVFVANFSKYVAKPEVNPFALVDVSFQGTDGRGEVVVERLNAPGNVDMDRIDYDISKRTGLLEGETITIAASSQEYRLEETVRTYVVEGLDMYLSDLGNIPEEALELIHAKAENVLELNLDGSKAAGFFVDMKPVKLFLTTDGKQTNELYDVFEVQFAANGEESVYYVLACFSDVLVREEEQASLNMSYGMYYGHLTQVWGSVWIMGYDSLEEVRTDILTSQESYMELKELEL